MVLKLFFKISEALIFNNKRGYLTMSATGRGSSLIGSDDESATGLLSGGVSSSANTGSSVYQQTTQAVGEWWAAPGVWSRIMRSVNSGQQRSNSSASGQGSQLSVIVPIFRQVPTGDVEAQSDGQQSSRLADCGQWTSAFCRELSFPALVRPAWTRPNCCENMSNPFRSVPVELRDTILASPFQTPEGHVALSDVKYSSGQELSQIQKLHVKSLQVIRDNPGLTLDEQTAMVLTHEVRNETTAMAKTLGWLQFSSKVGGSYILFCFAAYVALSEYQVGIEDDTFDTCIDTTPNSDKNLVQSNCRADAQLTNTEDMIRYVDPMYAIFGTILAFQALAIVAFVTERIVAGVNHYCIPKKAEDVRIGSRPVDNDAPPMVSSTFTAPLLAVTNHDQVVQHTSLQVVKDVVEESRGLGPHKLGVASAFLTFGYAKPLLARQQQYVSNAQAWKWARVILATTLFISAIVGPKIYEISVANNNIDDCKTANKGIKDSAARAANIFNCIEDEIFYAMVDNDVTRNIIMWAQVGTFAALMLASGHLLFQPAELAVRAMPTFGDVPELLVPASAAAAEELAAEGGLSVWLEEIRNAAGFIIPPASKLPAGGGQIDSNDLQQSIAGYSDESGVPSYSNTTVTLLRDVSGRETLGFHAGGVVAAHSRASDCGVQDAGSEMQLTGLLNDFAQVLSQSVEPCDISQSDAAAIMATHQTLMQTVNAMYEVPMDPTHEQGRQALARVLIKMSDVGQLPPTTAPAGGLWGGARPAPIVTGLKPALEAALLGEALDTSVTAGAAVDAAADVSLFTPGGPSDY
jgi:hypothetical protein